VNYYLFFNNKSMSKSWSYSQGSHSSI